MKKYILALFLLTVGLNAFSGEVGLPCEVLALPEIEGDCLVCIWDEASGSWLQDFEQYDHAGVFDFEVPAWGQWYWVGLWDMAAGEYVFGKWIGHFQVD